MSRAAVGLIALGFALAGPLAATARADIPPMSRAEIIARAESGVGTQYTWGRESWAPNAGGAGPDCSGYVLKAWEVPRSLLYQEEDPANAAISPRYTSYSFYHNQGPWTSLPDRSVLQEGDILVYNDGSSGHVMLYASGDGYGQPVVYEAPGTGYLVRRVSRYVGSAYRPKRRNSLTGSTVLLDNPTAKSTGGDDLGGNWKRSTSNAGYYGADYQVQAGSGTAAWARWTPRIPASGEYDVYLRWTSGWNRASNAKVTINTPSGQKVRYVDQRSNGGIWYFMGRFYLNAGYSTGSGSVAVHATGANGYVVADGARFLPVP